MSLLHSILLGLVQGVAEFLPISSSGHLAIVEQILGVKGAAEVPGFFDVLLHLGTLAAVFVAYWPEIWEMIQEFFRGISDLIHGTTPTPVPPARRMILLVIVGTLPLFAILGIKDWIESLSSNLYVVGGALIVTGCLLFASDRVRKGRKNEHSARMTDVLIVGAAQALATCPGLSRSGTTISVGCFLGFERKFAVRYSFIMSIPAVLGANILSLKDALGGEVIWKDVPVYLLGVLWRLLWARPGRLLVWAMICLSRLRPDLRWLRLKDLERCLANSSGQILICGEKFGAFAYYCWAVGLLTVILTLVGA